MIDEAEDDMTHGADLIATLCHCDTRQGAPRGTGTAHTGIMRHEGGCA